MVYKPLAVRVAPITGLRRVILVLDLSVDRHDARPDWREVAFDDVEIGAAHATGVDLEQHFPWLQLWQR
jgi:hypothetical protein